MEERRKIKFVIREPDAEEVALLGDFNHWNAGAHPMKRNADGRWTVSLFLPAGRYEYKLMVDGNWREASKRQPTVPNAFGTLNNVLIVPAKKESP